MWEVLGRDNAAVVQSLIAAAARLDQRYCAELQNLALLSRARALLRGSGDGLADALAQLLQQEPALQLARDHEGRSLWHDLAAGEHAELLQQLLPLAASGASEQAGQQAGVLQQVDLNPLNLPDLNGNTPLHVAAQASNAEAARLLIEAGAALDMQNRCGCICVDCLLKGCWLTVSATCLRQALAPGMVAWPQFTPQPRATLPCLQGP